jgi:hypothetical protein
MTVDELRENGIAFRFIGLRKSSDSSFANAPTFPNKCFYDPRYILSISDGMLDHFKKKGFTLQSLCLAMQSKMRYDVETGKPLPLAVPAKVVNVTRSEIKGWESELNAFVPHEGWIGSGIFYTPGVLLNVPDCFANGTPFMDCKVRFDAHYGGSLRDDDSVGWLRMSQEVDKRMRALILRGTYNRICQCSELGIDPNGDKHDMVAESLQLPPDCRVDAFPACEGKLAELAGSSDAVGADAIGALVEEDTTVIGRIIDQELDTDLFNGRFEISPRLPRGYGYDIGPPEGVDPESENVDLQTLGKESGASASWNQ